MSIMTLLAVALVGLLLLLIFAFRTRRSRFFRRPVLPPPDSHGFSRKKPEWVKRKVIRLKALMPHEGCRAIARAINSRHAAKGESVGKSYVAVTLRHNAGQILMLRRKINNRPRRQGPRNRVWGLDLTFLNDGKASRPVLGILDHGTRSLLWLAEVRLRSTLGILRVLLDVIERYGVPRFLRTDNEGIFTSRQMELVLVLLGIRHQKIDPFCPWQNGRIERLFWTLKERLALWWDRAGAPEDPQQDLDTFRTWYNHARGHQSLAGMTPAMAWAGVSESRKRPRFFSAWDDILTGFVVPT